MKKNQVTENWAPARYIQNDGTVLDFTGLYEVSDQGRVRSLNYHREGKTKELNPATYKNIDQFMSYKVTLRKDNKGHILSVHRLVLSTFKESEFFPGAVVDHINPRTSTDCDNRLSNLRWVTQQQNRNTEHCRALQSKHQVNQPSTSKHTRVTDLTTGETTVYPSAMEAGRALGINPKLVSTKINQQNGYYKKLNLHFAYV